MIYEICPCLSQSCKKIPVFCCILQYFSIIVMHFVLCFEDFVLFHVYNIFHVLLSSGIVVGFCFDIPL